MSKDKTPAEFESEVEALSRGLAQAIEASVKEGRIDSRVVAATLCYVTMNLALLQEDPAAALKEMAMHACDMLEDAMKGRGRTS